MRDVINLKSGFVQASCLSFAIAIRSPDVCLSVYLYLGNVANNFNSQSVDCSLMRVMCDSCVSVSLLFFRHHTNDIYFILMDI